jgi:septum formation protein
MEIVLASASPRRMELMKNLFEDFEQVDPDIEEIIPETIDPEEAPEYLAVKKAMKVSSAMPEKLIIACDTDVIIDGEILGKPADETEAESMLSKLSGRTHKVITGCCISLNGKNVSFSENTLVRFYRLSQKEIQEYIATGEPFDKAGGYGAQGKGMLLVHSIEGDFFNVMGLPAAKLKRVVDTFLDIEKD